MTAADFSNLHLQYKAEQAEGEVPAVIEHDFPGGRMVDHYFVTPSPAFWADEGVQSLDGVSGILFLQQPDGAPSGCCKNRMPDTPSRLCTPSSAQKAGEGVTK